MFRTGISEGKWTGKGAKTGKRELVFGRREMGREKDGISTGFPVFPSTSHFSSDQCMRLGSTREAMHQPNYYYKLETPFLHTTVAPENSGCLFIRQVYQSIANPPLARTYL
jgi:hypothetical protein